MDRYRASPLSSLGRLALAAACLAACFAPAIAAPVITEVLSSSPPHAMAEATVGIFGHGFDGALQVFFSDGTNPTVAAASVAVDAARGILVVRVPAAAATGYLKVVASGVDSNLFYFRRDTGTFDRGTSPVSGRVVTASLAPVPGAAVLLLSSSGCDGDMIFWDHAVTDAAGNYALQGQAASYLLFVFPPRATGLAVGVMPVTAPAVQDVLLSPAAIVSGRVVFASAPATGVARARVELEGDGFDTTVTDANGYFSVPLPPGPYELRATPPPSEILARSEDVAFVVGTGPQTIPDVALEGGVRIHGTVRRQSDSTPMPGIWLSAWPNGPGGAQGTDSVSAGDGSFALVVPPNGTYAVSTYVEDSEPYVPARADHVAVGASDVALDFTLAGGGFLRGRVTDQATSEPLADISVHAFTSPWSDSWPVAETRSCEDGSYTLHVAPAASGYLVAAGYGEDRGYVPAAFDALEGTTLFPCEGAPLVVSAVGSEVSGVDLPLLGGAGSISGAIRSLASGCSAPFDGFLRLHVDDGNPHACGLGMQDWNAPVGSYRVYGLPNVSALPVLRACVFPYGPESGQCYDGRSYPAFTSVPVPAGGSQSGVNFCVGNHVRPTQPVSSVTASKGGGAFTLSWSPTGEPATASYRVRGSVSARPGSPPGSFPDDPSFVDVWSGPATSAPIALSTPYSFFLVTPVGSTGLEGPSGHYPNVP